jgi:Flp pilus assembly protein TadG
MTTHRQRDERGESAVQMAILTPALIALLLLVVFAGRIAVSRQAVQSAAADAARAASIARNASDAEKSAIRIAEASLDAQQLRCATTDIDVDTSGFNAPPGTPASATVTITCDLMTSDLMIPVPGTVSIQATMSSPIDTYRENR